MRRRAKAAESGGDNSAAKPAYISKRKQYQLQRSTPTTAAEYGVADALTNHQASELGPAAAAAELEIADPLRSQSPDLSRAEAVEPPIVDPSTIQAPDFGPAAVAELEISDPSMSQSPDLSRAEAVKLKLIDSSTIQAPHFGSAAIEEPEDAEPSTNPASELASAEASEPESFATLARDSLRTQRLIETIDIVLRGIEATSPAYCSDKLEPDSDAQDAPAAVASSPSCPIDAEAVYRLVPMSSSDSDDDPTQRWAHTCCAIDLQLFVFGGYGGPTSHQRLNDLQVLLSWI